MCSPGLTRTGVGTRTRSPDLGCGDCRDQSGWAVPSFVPSRRVQPCIRILPAAPIPPLKQKQPSLSVFLENGRSIGMCGPVTWVYSPLIARRLPSLKVGMLFVHSHNRSRVYAWDAQSKYPVSSQYLIATLACPPPVLTDAIMYRIQGSFLSF